MNKIQNPAYKSPGLKTINLMPRSGVCQDASLLGGAIVIEDLDPSTGEPIDL